MIGKDEAAAGLTTQQVEALADQLTVITRKMSPDQILAVADRLHDVIRYRRERGCIRATVVSQEPSSWEPQSLLTDGQDLI